MRCGGSLQQCVKVLAITFLEYLADEVLCFGNAGVFPEYTVEVEVPIELLHAGPNSVWVTHRPLPGLPRINGMEIDRLAAVLEALPSP